MVAGTSFVCSRKRFGALRFFQMASFAALAGNRQDEIFAVKFTQTYSWIQDFTSDGHCAKRRPHQKRRCGATSRCNRSSHCGLGRAARLRRHLDLDNVVLDRVYHQIADRV